MADYTENVTFLTVSEFKTKTGTSSMQVLKNPNTGKLFLASDNGQNYKVQQAIDGNQEMKMLVPESGNLADACLTNVKPGAEVKFSL
jgi:hypothetical protein